MLSFCVDSDNYVREGSKYSRDPRSRFKGKDGNFATPLPIRRNTISDFFDRRWLCML
ncbi:hypothetical protein PCAR4_140090 [Paraburkholderia caribensis]|nr:hypothetical protein PCAR4_140090 [Paraburkholderia caribensis]